MTRRPDILTIRMEIDGSPVEFGYTSITELLLDEGLRALLDAGHVTGCIALYQGDQRIAGVARPEWGCLHGVVLDHSATILRGVGDPGDRRGEGAV